MAARPARREHRHQRRLRRFGRRWLGRRLGRQRLSETRPIAGFGDIRGLIVDLDGVLYVGDEPIAGAREALAELRGRDLGLRFATNTTTRSRYATLDKLRRLGFDVADEELFTPAVLASRVCAERGHSRVALIMEAAIKRDFPDLAEVPAGAGSADAVIVGDLGEDFGFEILNRAFRLVMAGADLIALQRNRFWRTDDGELSLDAGPFVAALEYATSREATVVGKPSAAFFDLALDSLDLDRGAVAMIGDDVETDVGGALAAGLRAIQVETGKYDERFVSESGITPTAQIRSVADLPGLLG
ncbi:TIGR01458 family HAD-type hydrolase [Thermoleophilia bacterium SCSIO 60948]|nr:TIGR01458 family HAD-type hydrolase [Thermoleophilia bacterium SCSIO 60948]